MRLFRTIPRGMRIIGGMSVPCGWLIEEKRDADWVLVDTLPPGIESAIQYARSVAMRMCLINTPTPCAQL